MKSLLVIFAIFLQFSTQSQASERSVKIEARVLESCGYFSSWDGEFVLNYMNSDLPWGTTIEILYGFHGWTSETQGQTTDWIYNKVSSLRANAPYKWTATITDQIASRGERWFDQLQFVLKVTLPNGHVFYEKGGNSAFGFYTTYFLDESGRGCQGDAVAFKPLTLIAVDRN